MESYHMYGVLCQIQFKYYYTKVSWSHSIVLVPYVFVGSTIELYVFSATGRPLLYPGKQSAEIKIYKAMLNKYI